MNSDQARQRAEKRFKQEERARDGQKAMIEHEVQARATREKTARLKALRLSKEARAQTEAPPVKQTNPPPPGREKWQLKTPAPGLRCQFSPATHLRGRSDRVSSGQECR